MSSALATTSTAPLLIALLPFVGAALVACLPAQARRSAAWVAGLVAMAVVALGASLTGAVFAGEVPRYFAPWVPTLGLAVHFRIDGLAWLFVMLVGGIGALIVLYAAWYLDRADPARRFLVFLLLFMGAMLGVVTAGNVLLLVVFWELTSLSSFLLIGYWHAREDARQGARMALAITGAGGLCLLAGALLIGNIVGSFELDVVFAQKAVLQAHPLFATALVLVLLGAFTKSAQFPFHFWLPHAMAAPTPVSAYLHSATMVKAGVFLLARLYPALGGNELWFTVVSTAGLITLLIGAYIAIFKHDLKGLLAYSTISHLGLITLLFGLDRPLAVVAGVFHIINHATFKAGLFMSAGIIDHECGTRDMRRLRGLMQVMPFTATLGMVAAASMAGVPLANGFLSKEMLFAETLAGPGHGAMTWLLPVGATLAAAFGVAYSLRFVHEVFFNGPVPSLPKTPHEAPFFMRLPVLVLVVICLAVGLAPQVTIGPTLAVAAQAAVFGAPGPALPEYKLAIWHGLNLPLFMSVVALLGGVALYFGLQRFVRLHTVTRLPGWMASGGREAFAFMLSAGSAAATAATARLQNGRLQRYLLLLVAMALAAGLWPFLVRSGPPAQLAALHWQGLTVPMAVVGAIGIGATLAATVAYRQRLLSLVLIGAIGLVVCLAFVAFSAPDLALTQLLVEVVTVILMMLALRWLPQESPPEARQGWAGLRRGVHALVAVACGMAVALLAWAVMTRPFGLPFDSISPYFLDNTLPLGGGANAVNVIIVDFRGYDTLGEITVLGLAGLIIHILLARFAPPAHGALRADNEADHPLILQIVARLVLPFAVLLSIYLYLRGHNVPGGGFIAGLVMAIGLALQYVAHGWHWGGARLGTDYRGWVGWGLLVAALTGVASWFFGAPFLTSTYDYPLWPVVGAVPLASAGAFDLGVYIVVVGATMVALLSIARLTQKRS
jgi:multicomponent K+:H+ antiporter subunit A